MKNKSKNLPIPLMNQIKTQKSISYKVMSIEIYEIEQIACAVNGCIWKCINHEVKSCNPSFKLMSIKDNKVGSYMQCEFIVPFSYGF